MQTPPRPKSTTLRSMDPPAFLPSRPGPQDASTSKSTSKPRSMRPPQPFNINKAPTTSHTTPLTSRTFRLDRILPLAAKSTPSPARKVVPFNELPKPMPHFQSPTLKSPRTDLRVLSAPNLSLGPRHKPSSLKSMSELNQPLTVDLEGELWGDNAEDVFGSSENRELMRGLLVSPEKPGTKGKKFLRYVHGNFVVFALVTFHPKGRSRGEGSRFSISIPDGIYPMAKGYRGPVTLNSHTPYRAVLRFTS